MLRSPKEWMGISLRWDWHSGLIPRTRTWRDLFVAWVGEDEARQAGKEGEVQGKHKTCERNQNSEGQGRSCRSRVGVTRDEQGVILCSGPVKHKVDFWDLCCWLSHRSFLVLRKVTLTLNSRSEGTIWRKEVGWKPSWPIWREMGTTRKPLRLWDACSGDGLVWRW